MVPGMGMDITEVFPTVLLFLLKFMYGPICTHKNTSVITKTPYMKIIDIHHSNLTNNKEMKLEQLTFCFIHTLEVNKGLKDCYKTSEM